MIRSIGVLLFFLPILSIAQIEIGGEEVKPTEKEKKEVKNNPENLGSSTFYVGPGLVFSNRILKQNDGYFGDSLGYRVNEIGVGTYNAEIGVRTELNEFLEFDGGVAYIRSGESYSFNADDSDSSYKYTNWYHSFAMPLKLHYYRGSKLKFFAGAGVMPQMTMQKVQELNWTDSEGSGESETIREKKEKLSPFLLSAVVDAGVNYSFNSGWGVYASLNYRRQLTSSFSKTYSFKHFAYSYGLSFGLTKRF